jgi:hypothetical protein
MFDSLNEQMRHDTRKSPKEWAIEILIVLVLAVVVFGGIFFGVRLLE